MYVESYNFLLVMNSQVLKIIQLFCFFLLSTYVTPNIFFQLRIKCI
jgi:hypothetical protein